MPVRPSIAFLHRPSRHPASLDVQQRLPNGLHIAVWIYVRPLFQHILSFSPNSTMTRGENITQASLLVQPLNSLEMHVNRHFEAA